MRQQNWSEVVDFILAFFSLSENVKVETLLKSVHIYQSYCKKNLAQFFWPTLYAWLAVQDRRRGAVCCSTWDHSHTSSSALQCCSAVVFFPVFEACSVLLLTHYVFSHPKALSLWNTHAGARRRDFMLVTASSTLCNLIPAVAESDCIIYTSLFTVNCSTNIKQTIKWKKIIELD